MTSMRRETRYADADAAATTWALTVGGLTTAAIAFWFGAVNGSPGTAVLVAGAGGIASGALLKRGLTPARGHRPARRRPPRGPFATVAQLQHGRHMLLRSRNEHAQHLKEKLDVRQRLVRLRERMRELGLAAYEPRIASIDRAVATIDRQVDVISRLRDGYDRSIRMIEIELEAGAAAETLSEDVGAMIVSAIRELKSLEASQAELARQLEANIEVEQLLRAGT